jgi:hypothetical protein
MTEMTETLTPTPRVGAPPRTLNRAARVAQAARVLAAHAPRVGPEAALAAARGWDDPHPLELGEQELALALEAARTVWREEAAALWGRLPASSAERALEALAVGWSPLEGLLACPYPVDADAALAATRLHRVWERELLPRQELPALVVRGLMEASRALAWS